MTDRMNSRHRPWMKFYPSDWQSDEGLRQCSLGARGLWIEMIAVMHKSSRYGFLLVAGQNPTQNQIATQVGSDPKTVGKLLAELEGWGVFSRDDDGVIYSRRMVTDFEKAEVDSQNGKRGGNPSLKATRDQNDGDGDKGGVNPPLNPQANPTDKGGDKAQIPETRILEREESNPHTPLPAEITVAAPPAGGRRLILEGFDEWWKAYPRKIAKGAAEKVWTKAVATASAQTLIDAVKRAKWHDDPKFIPHPATWLSQKRWMDDDATAITKPDPRPRPRYDERYFWPRKATEIDPLPMPKQGTPEYQSWSAVKQGMNPDWPPGHKLEGFGF